MSLFGQVNPDLILSSGFQSHLERCQIPQTPEHSKMGYGEFAALFVIRGMHTKVVVFNEAAPDSAPCLLNPAFNYGPIFPFNFMPDEKLLKRRFCPLRLRENQNSARKLVQAVDNKKLLLRIVFFQVAFQITEGRPLPLVDSGNGEQAGRLLNNENRGIFVDYFEVFRELLGNSARSDFQSVSLANLMRCQSAGSAVHADAALLQHLTQRSPGSSRNQEQKGIQ